MHLTPGVVLNIPKPWIYMTMIMYVPDAQEDPKFLFGKGMGKSLEFVSHLTMDGVFYHRMIWETSTCELIIKYILEYMNRNRYNSAL